MGFVRVGCCGRVGRVFPGVCVRLVSSSFYNKCLRVFDLPEMQTAPLDKLYITVAHLTKRLNAIAKAAHALSPTEAPPLQPRDRPSTIQGEGPLPLLGAPQALWGTSWRPSGGLWRHSGGP